MSVILSPLRALPPCEDTWSRQPSGNQEAAPPDPKSAAPESRTSEPRELNVCWLSGLLYGVLLQPPCE